MLLISLFYLIIEVVAFQSDYSMVVTYGAPTTSWDPITISADSWDTCVRICYLDTYCVMAHQTPAFCHHYHIGKVFAAERLTAEDQSLIAIKGNKSSSVACQSQLESIDQTVYIKNASLPQVSMSYKLTLSGNTFTMAYTITGLCTSGQVFFRPTATYCIQVVTDYSKNALYNASIDACLEINENSTLAGLESLEEKAWVTDQVNATISHEKTYSTIGIWISGQRRTECPDSNDSSKPECAGLKAFNFSDQYLTSKGGYQWAPGQPNSNFSRTQNCLQLQVTKNESDPNYGLVDDTYCSDGATRDGYAMRGYVCGWAV